MEGGLRWHRRVCGGLAGSDWIDGGMSIYAPALTGLACEGRRHALRMLWNRRWVEKPDGYGKDNEWLA